MLIPTANHERCHLDLSETKILVIGIDSATFDLIEPWVKSGELPTFHALMKSGVYGRLLSTIPPETPAAWTSLVTGKNAGKHGIFDFQIRRLPKAPKSLVTAMDRDSRTIWNILSDAGKTCGIVTVPITYPPESVNGFIISGFLTPPDKTDITYPPELWQEIVSKLGKCRPHSDRLNLVKDGIIREIRAFTDEQERMVDYLFESHPVDFFMWVYMGIDPLQHVFWKYMDPRHSKHTQQGKERYGNVILESYRRIDRMIGRILNKHMDENTVLFVVSDHGAGRLEKVVFVNNWLRQIGLLHLKTNRRKGMVGTCLSRLGLTYNGLEGLFMSDSELMNAGVALVIPILKKALPRWLIEAMVDALPKDRLTSSDIDWSRTKAYSFGDFGQIDINLKGREPDGIVEPGEEYEKVRNYIVQHLRELTDPITGEKMVTEIYTNEQLYNGKYSYRGPDVFVIFRGMEYSTVMNSDFGQAILGSPSQSGTHRMNGIFISKGKGIKQDMELDSARIIDVAPTILHVMGSAVPEDMDGRVLKEIFEPNSTLATRDVRYEKVVERKDMSEFIMSKDDQEKVEARLRQLGYLT